MLCRLITCAAALSLVQEATAKNLDNVYLRGSQGYDVSGPSYRVEQVPPSQPAGAAAPWHAFPLTASAAVVPPPLPIQEFGTWHLRGNSNWEADSGAAYWSWTGLYAGAHVGAGSVSTQFADPFGVSVFGDTTRSPGFLGGGQIGYNWQPLNSPWVLGVEADASALGGDGTATCFAVSAITINATCQVRPQAVATVTGRVGSAVGPQGRTLLYAKGGFAWTRYRIDMATGNALAGSFGPAIAANSATVTNSGGTVGAGIEYSLTRAWSLKAEYDYLAFSRGSVANLGSFTVSPVGVTTGFTPAGTSSVIQNIHEFKLGMNYRPGADPWAWWEAVPVLYSAHPVKTLPVAIVWIPGWEIEGGGRYYGSWGQFHKDIGLFTNSGLPDIASVSRLTYDDMKMNSSEFFGRLDTPWNFFIKGFIGGGSRTASGHMNDEDFGIPLLGPGTDAAYSNTLSSVVNGDIGYGAVDAGYDFLSGPGYRVGAFAGFFQFHQAMSAFGCTPIANVNCLSGVPTSGNPNITEDDTWKAPRVGLSGEAMLTDQLKITGDIAYLPFTQFNGVDHHFFGNTGILAENFVEAGHGQGAQFEALVSYYLTPAFSFGVGGRYWALWTTGGQVGCTFGAFGLCGLASAPQQFRAQTEHAGILAQAAYKFVGK